MHKVVHSENIRAALAQKGWTQKQLAEALDVSAQAVTLWLKGEGLPRPDKLLKLATTLKLSLGQLVKFEDPDRPVIAFRKRAATKTTQQHVDDAVTRGKLLRALVPSLPELKALRTELPNPSVAYADLQRAVSQTRTKLGIGQDVEEALEEAIHALAIEGGNEGRLEAAGDGDDGRGDVVAALEGDGIEGLAGPQGEEVLTELAVVAIEGTDEPSELIADDGEPRDGGELFGEGTEGGVGGDEPAELGGIGVTGSNLVAEDVKRLVDLTMEKWGRVDALVNSAGHGPRAPILEITDEDWHRGMEVYFLAAVRPIRLVAPKRFGRTMNGA